MSLVTLLDQSIRAERVVLVLAEEEFPDRSLPKEYARLQQHGLEILWTSRNIRSYKKLLPVLERYPGADIITADDDILYSPNLVAPLVHARSMHPTRIIGHRGWQMRTIGGRLLPYRFWPQAAPGATETSVLLTSGAGVLFPGDFLKAAELRNVDAALATCPTADDVWFWAMSVLEGWTSHCLGNHLFVPLRAQQGGPELFHVNYRANDAQIAQVIDRYQLRGEWNASGHQSSRLTGSVG
jgi:hypothetical protein